MLGGFSCSAAEPIFFFWQHIQKVNTPFLQPALLRNKNYLKIIFIVFTNFAAHFSTLFCLPILLAVLFDQEPGAIGLFIFPGALTAAIASIFVGRIIDRFGTVPIMVSGLGLLLVSMFLFVCLSGIAPLYNMLSYIPLGVGFFALTSSLSNELTRILPAEQVGGGLGMMQMTQFFGVAFGVTVAGFLISLQVAAANADVSEHLPLFFRIGLVLRQHVDFLYLRSKRKSSLDDGGMGPSVSSTGLSNE